MIDTNLVRNSCCIGGKWIEPTDEGLEAGNGVEVGVDQDPLIDEAAVAKVEEQFADATNKGATIAFGGQRHSPGGSFFQPTVLTGATPGMANDTEFGLAAYFFSRDLGRVWRVSEGLEYGKLGINSGIISTEVAPLVGSKRAA